MADDTNTDMSVQNSQSSDIGEALYVTMDWWVSVLLAFGLAATNEANKNVLFLVADDMRPQLEAYKGLNYPAPVSPNMITPNLDSLASKSLLLQRAHTQQALCTPSRTSCLTGRRPDTTHVTNLFTYWRDTAGNFTTIPQYFKENGYHSVGLGKIFHPGRASNNDDPISWSEEPWHAPARNGFWQQFGNQQSWAAVNESMIDEHGQLADQQIGDRAIEYLQHFTDNQQPFFLAVGFYKPHLPFLIPEEFLNLYPEEIVSLPDNEFAPSDMPSVAWSKFFELGQYPDIAMLNNSGYPNDILPAEVVLQLRRAYYGAVSYIDDQIGRVLGELDRLGLTKDTIILFWGDHGYQLGEHGAWCKQNNFELSTHVPMMISVPGVTDQGISTEKLVEAVDIFPTLVNLAELPSIPMCPQNSSGISVCTEGVSMVPLMQNPYIEWKPRVFSQYPRSNGAIMGYTLRDDRYRYTEWVGYDQDNHQPIWDQLDAVELYDHFWDPDENTNLADDPKYAIVQGILSFDLHLGWREALPPYYAN